MRIFFLTPKEIAKYLRVEPDTVREWCASGKYGNCKIGTQYRVPLCSLVSAHRDIPLAAWHSIIDDLYSDWRDREAAKRDLHAVLDGLK